MTPRRLLFASLAFALAFAAPALPVRAEDEPVSDEDSKPAPKPKKKAPAKKKTFDYEKSKYKSREPAQTSNFKFNEKGEPISAEKKKAAAKKKKRSEPPEIGSLESAGACGSEESCIEKKTEADAL